MSGESTGPRWGEQKQEARIGVLPRHGSAADMRWFTVKPGFVLHSLNAYEEEEEGGERDPETGKAATTVVLQAFRFDAFSALSLADLPAHLESYEVCRLHEYRLHLPSGTSSERSICPVSTSPAAPRPLAPSLLPLFPLPSRLPSNLGLKM
eukprot:jgi/Mesen1/4658/ME000241S03696